MITAGQRVPNATLQRVTAQGSEPASTRELFGEGRSVLFAVPGAFTPTCSERHLPGYVRAFDEFASRDVRVACLAVNDPFVLRAWGESQHVPEGLMLLADGNAEFCKALGLAMDASAYGMGTRARRFALLIEDGVVRHVAAEADGALEASTAEAMLEVTKAT